MFGIPPFIRPVVQGKARAVSFFFKVVDEWLFLLAKKDSAWA